MSLGFSRLRRGVLWGLLSMFGGCSRQTVDDWDVLCELISPGDSSLKEEVRLARTDKEGYFARYEDQLWERGIEAAAGVQPWLALIDGLERRGLLREFDWKLEREELRFQLEKLRPCKQQNVCLAQLGSTSAEGETLFSVAASELAGYSLALLWFHMESDSYPSVVVPVAEVERVIAAAARVGEQVLQWPPAA